MRYLTLLVILLGVLFLVDSKAVQNNFKGKYDHMYENLYWKKIAEKKDAHDDSNYEMKYVPHIDGKPIFIPELSFGEFDTVPIEGIMRDVPNKWKNKYQGKTIQTTNSPSISEKHGHSLTNKHVVHESDSEIENKQHLNTYSDSTKSNTKHTEIKSIKSIPSNTHTTQSKKKNIKVKQPSPIKVETLYEPKIDKVFINKQVKPGKQEDYDHPVVVDVITNKLAKSDTIKNEKYNPPVVIRSTKKKFVTKKNRPPTSEIVKSSEQSSQEYLKAKTENKHAYQDTYKENDHPIVIDVVTKKQSYTKDNKYDPKNLDLTELSDPKAMKNDEESKYTNGYKNPPKDKISVQTLNQGKDVQHEFIEDFNEEVTEDFQLPVVIRSFPGKHKKNGGVKKEYIQNGPLKTVDKKSGLYEDSKIKTPENKNIKYEKSLEHSSAVTAERNVAPSEVVSIKLKPTKVDNVKYKLSSANVDPRNNLPEGNGPLIEKSQETGDFSAGLSNQDLEIRDRPLDFLSNTNQENEEEENDESEVALNAEEDYEDYDSPVVEDLERKNVDNEQYDYDPPEIVEALVKKTTNIDQYDYKDYDQPNVVEALVKKTADIDKENYGHSSKVVIASVKKDTSKPADKLMIPEKKEHGSSMVEVSKHTNEEKGYNHSVLFEDVVKKSHVKNNKKRIKYSHKLKNTKSPIYSHYEDNSKLKEVLKSELIQNYKYPTSFKEHEQGDLKAPDIDVNHENIAALTHQALQPTISAEESDTESISNNGNEHVDLGQFSVDKGTEKFGDETDQFDSGSGINEKSGLLDDSRSLFSKSNIWPLLNFQSQERNKFKKCITPTKEPGNCMPIQMCPVPNLQLTLDDLLKKICAVDEVFIGICCPEFPAETLKVTWDNLENISSSEHNTSETKPEDCGKIQEFGKDPQSWPWMAPLISVTTRRIFCGGVLIKEQYVLTAAHCTRKIPHNQILVVLGPMTSEKDPTNQEFAVVEIKRHAQYNPKTMQNDLALLKLSRRVPIGDTRRFICLPDEETFVGENALMLGWQGSFAASKNEEKLMVISAQECRKDVKVVAGDNIMCTEPRTEDVMCNVDSGAPLIVKKNDQYQVIGLLTWNRNDCDSNFPSIFTRVSHFKRWIENHAV